MRSIFFFLGELVKTFIHIRVICDLHKDLPLHLPHLLPNVRVCACTVAHVCVCFPQVFLLIFGLLQRLIGCLHALRVVDFYLKLLGGIQRVKITAIKLQIRQEWNHESSGRTLEGYLLILGLK